MGIYSLFCIILLYAPLGYAWLLPTKLTNASRDLNIDTFMNSCVRHHLGNGLRCKYCNEIIW